MRSRVVARWSAMLACAFATLAHGQAASPSVGGVPKAATRQNCLAAAKAAIGPHAQMLKCGDLTGHGALEVAAVVPLKRFRTNADGIPVSKLVILRKQVGASQWITKFTADETGTKNEAGFVATDFIDDSNPITGYRVSFSHWRSNGTRGFTMYVFYLSPGGSNEGIPVEVGWNPAVGRFQEIDYGEGDVFQTEIKNPPHIRTRGCKCK